MQLIIIMDNLHLILIVYFQIVLTPVKIKNLFCLRCSSCDLIVIYMLIQTVTVSMYILMLQIQYTYWCALCMSADNEILPSMHIHQHTCYLM